MRLFEEDSRVLRGSSPQLQWGPNLVFSHDDEAIPAAELAPDVSIILAHSTGDGNECLHAIVSGSLAADGLVKQDGDASQRRRLKGNGSWLQPATGRGVMG